MNLNNLKCRCGSTENWKIDWSMSIDWELSIVCENCGAVHVIGHSSDYNCKANNLKGGKGQ